MEERPHWTEAIESLGHELDFEWKPSSDNFDFSKIEGSRGKLKQQSFNHFDNHLIISDKAQLFKTLTDHYTKGICPFLPPTFCLDTRETDFEQNLKRLVSLIGKPQSSLHSAFEAGSSLWIVKPSLYSRGCGVEVFRAGKELQAIVNAYQTGYTICDFDKVQNNSSKYCQSRFVSESPLSKVEESTYKPKLKTITVEFPAYGLKHSRYSLHTKRIHYPNNT